MRRISQAISRFGLLLVLVMIAAPPYLWAQEHAVKGFLVDVNDNTPLVGATALLVMVKDTANSYGTAADDNGHFEIVIPEPTFYRLTVSSVGYEPFTSYVRAKEGLTDLGSLGIRPDVKVLQEIKILADVVPVEQKGDTTQFNAQAYKTNPDANAEDLIKKMPGILVDQSGVQAQGEQVQKVLVDGREFFGQDPTLALRSMPAEVIEKIEVFDQLSEQAQLTGFDDGDRTRTINIVTRAEMRDGTFGRVYGGVGSGETYSGGGNLNFFNGDRRITVVGMANNVNQQNFSSEDVLGIAAAGTSGRGRARGGDRGGGQRGGDSPGGGFSRGGNVNNFMTGQQNGIAETQALGLNFSDLWGEKINISGSYFFNHSQNTNDQFVNRETFLDSQTSQFYDEGILTRTNDYNHRLNIRAQYTIDSRNSIIFSPRISFQDNNAVDILHGSTRTDIGELINQTSNDYKGDNVGFNYSGNLSFRHSFEKRGRSLSLGLRTQANNRVQDTDLNSENQFYQGQNIRIDSINQFADLTSAGYGVSGNIAYTEPLGTKTQLQINYRLNYTESDSDKATFNYEPGNEVMATLDTILSNNFKNTYITHSPSTGLIFRDGKWMFRTGVAYQLAELQSRQLFPIDDEISQSFRTLLPTAMVRYTVSRQNNLTFFYRSMTQAPGISQLQNVVDNTNPLFLSTGNPDLKQSYSHMLVTRYSNTNTQKSSTFFIFLLLRNTNDYITNSTFIAEQDSVLREGSVLSRGSQISQPLNMDGYWNARTFSTYGFPIGFLKSNLNLNGGVSYSRVPGLTNGIENISRLYNLSSGLVLSSNISEKVDFTLSYSADYNLVENSIQPELNSNYLFQKYGAKINWIFGGGFVFRNSLDYQLYSGLSDGFNDEFALWNVSLGRKLFKNQNGEILVSVFDLLKQNTSIARVNTASYVEETRTEVLQQYFMATFTYTIRSYKNLASEPYRDQ